MKDRAPLGGLIRDSRETTSRYEQEVVAQVFSSIEACATYATQEELGSSWGIFCDAQGDFRLTTLSDSDSPPGFVRWCPPVPLNPPQKWGNYCGCCGGVIWAGQAACSECGWEEPR